MFRALRDDPRPRCRIELDGTAVEAPAGTNLAAFLLTAEPADGGPLRASPVSGAPRAPYCLMGVCFECLVEVDGVRDRQACLTTIRDGMRVRRQLVRLDRQDG
jgi:predicted molibdopterin-dependent oxidoreductase YjgC